MQRMTCLMFNVSYALSRAQYVKTNRISADS